MFTERRPRRAKGSIARTGGGRAEGQGGEVRARGKKRRGGEGRIVGTVSPGDVCVPAYAIPRDLPSHAEAGAGGGGGGEGGGSGGELGGFVEPGLAWPGA